MVQVFWKLVPFLIGGERGIRTLGKFNPTHEFQSCALDQLSHLSNYNTCVFYQIKIKMSSIKLKIIFFGSVWILIQEIKRLT